MSAPYIPGLTKPSGKDNVFLTLSGTRTSTPLDEYATVPTDAEKSGDFSALGQPAIYDPLTLQQFVSNVIPSIRIAPQAAALLKYYPEPNLPGTVQNYHLLTTAQSNSTQAGVRYMRSLGANASPLGFGGRGGGGRRAQQNEGLRQSINFNYNWSHSAQDKVNMFPQLGGKTSSDSNSGAGRLHGGLSPRDQHLQHELEPQQQPDDELLHQSGRHRESAWRHRAERRVGDGDAD